MRPAGEPPRPTELDVQAECDHQRYPRSSPSSPVSPVSNCRSALTHLDHIAIGVANVAARLAVPGLRLGNELGTSTAPQLIAFVNVRHADIHEARNSIGVGRYA